MNWNILITSGKEIKRDFSSNVNEKKKVLKSKMECIPVWIKGEPSSKTKYDIYAIVNSTERELIEIAIL